VEDWREKEASTERVNNRQEEGKGRGWGEENLACLRSLLF